MLHAVKECPLSGDYRPGLTSLPHKTATTFAGRLNTAAFECPMSGNARLPHER
jgi:hypothetical protein